MYLICVSISVVMHEVWGWSMHMIVGIKFGILGVVYFSVDIEYDSAY